MINDSYNMLYYLLAFLRIILTCLPEIGYIHPDEFFQTFEVLAGKILEVEVNKPWEFNHTFPIRNTFTPYLTVGLGFKILKVVNYFTETWFATTIMTPYYVLIFPRLLMCVISFVNDFCLYRICKKNNEKFKSRLIILASSFVILTYGNRTFSNTIELALFSLLLYYVSESMIFSNIIVRQSDYLNMRHSKATSPAEKAKFHKLRLYLPDHSFRNCFFIATIVTVGFFNRPTFVAFAAGPVFFWLYRGIGSKSVMSFHFNIRMFLFVLCTIPTVLLMVIFDSFYFGYISWGEIGMLDVSINSFVVTPLNFIRYNIDNKNLAKHGLHPRYLHFVINIPLLFNVMGFLAFYDCLAALKRILKGRIHLLPQIKTIRALMIVSSVIALVVLSIFPHQEPRFLIPLLLPFVYLHGMSILKEPELTLMEQSKKDILEKSTASKRSSHGLLKFWILANVVTTLFYGFVHQGGVIQLPGYFYENLKQRQPMTDYHLVTSYIYSIPYSLFLQKPYHFYSPSSMEEKSYRRFHLHELGSANFPSLAKTLVNIHNKCMLSHGHNSKDCELFVLLPTCFEEQLQYSIAKYTDKQVIRQKVFYPHFSAEAFSCFEVYCLNWFPFAHCNDKVLLSTSEYLIKTINFFTLSLYKISFK